MNLHFITSISQDYWDSTARTCIKTWNLPGKVTIFIDQSHGDLDWLDDVPFHKRLLSVPTLKVDEFTNVTKVRKFWGKTCSQIIAVRNRDEDERIIWLDADVEQLSEVNEELFNFSFEEPVAALNSQHPNDSWETGLIIFNQQNYKLNQFMKIYERTWNDEDILTSLWKPYDAPVFGFVAEQRGFYNLCTAACKNLNALENSNFSNYFKHHINKKNKESLKNENSSNLS